MAQTIHCDVHGRSHPADVLVSQIANGDTMAACFAGYVELARALVADAEVRAAELAAAELARAAGEVDADQAEADLAAADVERRLAGERSPEADALGVAAVVPKGTSRSRRAHEARQRARKAKVTPEAAPAAVAAPEPASEPTQDADVEVQPS